MRWPSDSLDSRLMLTELCQWLLLAPCTPNHKFVVIASRSQLLIIPRPLKSTDFLAMAIQFSKVTFLTSHVSVKNCLVTASRTEESIVPGNTANATLMAVEGPHDLLLGRIPDLELTCVGTHSEVMTISAPLDTCDSIVWSDVWEFGNLWSRCVPKVNTWAETHGQNILRRPVNKIQIEVVSQTRSIEHLEWILCNVSLLRILCWQKFWLIKATENGERCFWVFISHFLAAFFIRPGQRFLYITWNNFAVLLSLCWGATIWWLSVLEIKRVVLGCELGILQDFIFILHAIVQNSFL